MKRWMLFFSALVVLAGCTESGWSGKVVLSCPPAGAFRVLSQGAIWKGSGWNVTGGAYPVVGLKAEKAMDQLRWYVLDHQLTAAAMPFQSLETERNKEADTAKWVTRVVVPVP